MYEPFPISWRLSSLIKMKAAEASSGSLLIDAKALGTPIDTESD
jgi:hypothetical protein